MSSDFDFGEFLDESNQSKLMILCLDLFGVLTKFQVDHTKLEAAKIEVLNNELTIIKKFIGPIDENDLKIIRGIINKL